VSRAKKLADENTNSKPSTGMDIFMDGLGTWIRVFY